jgi:actin-like ATPase involved in cell morphogenesis
VADHCDCGQEEPCDVTCIKHERVLHGYPCGACEAEWRAVNPKTAEAISRLASGKGSVAAVNAARKADLEAKR